MPESNYIKWHSIVKILHTDRFHRSAGCNMMNGLWITVLAMINSELAFNKRKINGTGKKVAVQENKSQEPCAE